MPGDYVGWEWDAVPTQPQYLSRQPQGVTRLSESAINAPGGQPSSWLVDEGRNRSTAPPPGQPASANAVKYRVPSGALVFAAGTIQWYRGLVPSNDSSPSPRVQQATYNVFADMGVQPLTPAGVTLDLPNRPPTAVAKATPTSGDAPLNVSFDGSASTDPDGLIARFDWDLDGDGEFDDGLGPKATFAYDRAGTYTARLRVTDPADESAVATLAIKARADGTTGPPGEGGRRSLARISSIRLLRGRQLAIRIRCKAAASGACAGNAAATVSGTKAGHKRFRRLSPNRSATLRVKLTRAGLRRLQVRPAMVRVTLTVRDAAGLGATTRRALRVPRRG